MNGGLFECSTRPFPPRGYREPAGDRRGVPGPGGISNAAVTATSRTRMMTVSGSIMGISLAYTNKASHERFGDLSKGAGTRLRVANDDSRNLPSLARFHAGSSTSSYYFCPAALAF